MGEQAEIGDWPRRVPDLPEPMILPSTCGIQTLTPSVQPGGCYRLATDRALLRNSAVVTAGISEGNEETFG